MKARLKKAWENRDPRLGYNVILPYGEPYMGGDPNRMKVVITVIFLMYSVGR